MTTVELSNQLSKHNKSLIEKEQTPEVDFFYIPKIINPPTQSIAEKRQVLNPPHE